MAFQTVIIALLVLHYNGFSSWALAYLIGYTVAMVFLLFPLVPDQLLSFLQASVVFMVIISKVRLLRLLILFLFIVIVHLCTYVNTFINSIIHNFSALTCHVSV